MSKYLKNLMTTELKNRWEGVTDAVVVDVIGMEVNSSIALRDSLREKDMHLMVVKNSLARRASEGSPLAKAFEGMDGSMAVVWGGEDIVSLAKEVVNLAKDERFESMKPRGGVMEGKQLSAEDVAIVSKWPSRTEQLSMLVGQILSPGATLSAQLLGPGAKLVSQFKKMGEGDSE